MYRHKEPPQSIPQTRSPFQRGKYTDCYIYKVVVVGDADTGKTSMLGSFTGKDFNPTYTPTTIGVDFQIGNIKLDEIKIKLQLYDTGDYTRFRTITRTIYRGCAGIVITYNATKEETFENVPYWIEEISRYARPDAKIVLVGTNGDRVDEKVVDYTRARDFASERQIPFFEVSSKDGTNVELAIMTLVAQLRQLQIELEKA